MLHSHFIKKSFIQRVTAALRYWFIFSLQMSVKLMFRQVRPSHYAPQYTRSNLF